MPALLESTTKETWNEWIEGAVAKWNEQVIYFYILCWIFLCF